jgi:hypothetical protein
MRSAHQAALRRVAQVWRNLASWRTQLAPARIPASPASDSDEAGWTPFLPLSQSEETLHSAKASQSRRWSRPWV